MQRIFLGLGLALLKALSYLPTLILSLMGKGLGFIAYHLAVERRNVGLKNLSLCFPQMPEVEKKQIIKKHFQYLCIALFEYSLLFYASSKRVRRLVRPKNLHYLQEYYLKRPVIILSPHFVGLDIGAVRLSMDFCGYTMYSRQKSDLVSERLKKARTRFALPGSKVFARQEGLRTIIREMKQTNYPFYYLPDQDFGERDSIYTPFFAFPTCATITTLPKLAKLTQAVIIPLVIYRVDNHYEAEFFPAWDNYPTDNLENDVRYMNEFIEKSVERAMPQYFWLHKRFKTQPDGRHKLYQ